MNYTKRREKDEEQFLKFFVKKQRNFNAKTISHGSTKIEMADPGGVEPPNFLLKAWRVKQLHHKREYIVIKLISYILYHIFNFSLQYILYILY